MLALFNVRLVGGFTNPIYLQDKDSRIFLLSMFSITALPFLCEVSLLYVFVDVLGKVHLCVKRPINCINTGPMHMQAYHQGIRYPKYVIMTLGRFRKFWWRQEIPDLTCTADQRESVMASSLAFTENYFLDEVRDANITTTSGMVRLRLLY
jgi:hypothetical protein